MKIWGLLSVSFYLSYQSVYLLSQMIYIFLKTLWFLSNLCSIRGIFFISLTTYTYYYCMGFIDSYLHPLYDYFQITDSIPSRQDIFVTSTCSIIYCENPSLQILQMIVGWKPINKTFIYEYFEIDVFKLTHTFGKAVGEGMICELKTDVKSYFQNFFTNVITSKPIYYVDNK